MKLCMHFETLIYVLKVYVQVLAELLVASNEYKKIYQVIK
jgi:hypothetical protein